jgi:hypothetical protein
MVSVVELATAVPSAVAHAMHSIQNCRDALMFGYL